MSAGAPAVRGVVALAPWVYPTDVAPGAADRRILIVHGARDRVASPERSAALARALGARYLSVPEGKHAMLQHGREFVRPAVEFVLDTFAHDLTRVTTRRIIPLSNTNFEGESCPNASAPRCCSQH